MTGLIRDFAEPLEDLRVRCGSAKAFAAAMAGRRMVRKVRAGDSGRDSVTVLMCSYLITGCARQLLLFLGFPVCSVCEVIRGSHGDTHQGEDELRCSLSAGGPRTQNRCYALAAATSGYPYLPVGT